jgi:predicted PolB exonuclease-like 3'-5' exonuclease
MKPSRYLVLDLETVLDTSLPPPPKKKKGGGDVFPPPPYHAIVVLGCALLDTAYRVRRIWVAGEDKNEAAALASLAGFLGQQPATTIVTWNGRGFDLPVIVARCLKHGVPFRWYYATREPRYRYSVEGHCDVMDLLADNGAARSYGLDLAAKLIGLPGKLDCKGSNVQAMIDAGKIEDVRAYCMQDVAQTAALFQRTLLLRGDLSPTAYAQAMEALLASIAREPRLRPLLPGIDRERLLGVAGSAVVEPSVASALAA